MKPNTRVLDFFREHNATVIDFILKEVKQKKPKPILTNNVKKYFYVPHLQKKKKGFHKFFNY